MSKKRVEYKNLLKEAIAEFDTSKTVDVKGPMLDPILKWDGDGELPIYKDAASILERYYFNEKHDKGVEVSEMEYNEDGTEAKTASEKDAEGAGTTQAGTSDKNIAGEKKDIAKDIAKEAKDEMMDKEDEEDLKEQEDKAEEMEDKAEEMEDKAKEMEDKTEEMKESAKLTEDLENAVIEKLIAEMEEEDDEEDLDEMDMTYTGEGPKEEAPKEKKASGPMEDTKGAGTEQAGTGTAAGQIPDRKDNADKMVKAKNYNEQDEMMKDEEKDDEELDIDEKVKNEAAAVPGGPSPKKAKNAEDWQDDVYEEAFRIFEAAIKDEE